MSSFRRGHGRSTNPTREFTHRQSALDIFALLDALGIKEFKAMGISTGGMTLIHMATQQPMYERRRQIHKNGDEQIRDLRQEFHDFKDSYDDMNFTKPYLSTITARTLIIQGDRDEFFPVEMPVEMYRSIPKSELWIVPDGGHVPILDPLVPFTQTTLKFLDEAASSSR